MARSLPRHNEPKKTSLLPWGQHPWKSVDGNMSVEENRRHHPRAIVQ